MGDAAGDDFSHTPSSDILDTRSCYWYVMIFVFFIHQAVLALNGLWGSNIQYPGTMDVDCIWRTHFDQEKNTVLGDTCSRLV